MSSAARARRVAGLKPWADCRPRYRLTLGGAALPFDTLTDEALADLRSTIARDVRRERRQRSAYLASERMMFRAPVSGTRPDSWMGSLAPEHELGMTVGCFASTTRAACLAHTGTSAKSADISAITAP